ncbi:MAG: type II toxin-antitoxin system VapC family toxin, partial [Vicinamibacterales bacterium]
LRAWLDEGVRLGLSTLVLYEWRRGPRTREELADQETLFPSAAAVAFSVREAEIAADIYRRLGRPRPREIDIAIAACAFAQDAALWTLNPRDFRDIPGLRLATR